MKSKFLRPTWAAIAPILCALAGSTVHAATFTVTVTNENGAGTLRQAILDANASPGPDLIAFNIATAGKTISPTNALPAITEPVTIDGTTQPGFSGVPLVEINGQSAGTGTDGLRIWSGGTTIRGLVINRFNGDGVEIATNGNNIVEGCWIGLGTDGTTRRANANGIFITNSPNNTIGGLNATQRNLITGNNQNGVRVDGPGSSGTLILGNWIGLNVNSATGVGNSQSGVYLLSAPSNTIGGTATGAGNLLSGNSQNGVRIEGTNALANVVLGNFIGLDLTGTTNRANGNNGVYLLNAPSNTIGGATTAARNVIAGNSQVGVRLDGAATRGNRVLGNFIGTDVSGALARGNTGEGIYLLNNPSGNVIGGTNAGEANLIANNGSDGIWIQNGTNNTARGNSIHSNTGLGIDLGNTGVQANDAGDADTGANQLQNFPILSAATNSAGGLFVAGSLNSRPGSAYTLDFYSNVARDPSTNGEGQVWLGALGVTTGADSNATFSITFPAGASGRFISATATDTNGNTSEFSPCVRAESTLPPLTFIVTNANDSGPGSLRQAILDNNSSVRGSRNGIVFAIPGAGPHTIAPASPLPSIMEAVAVDGFTQFGSASNSLPVGNNAVWKIVLEGTLVAAAGTDGLRVEASDCVIQGLAIIRFADNGIELATNANCAVRGCLIGLGLDGSDQGNQNSGIYLINSAGNLIGGATPDARNIISGQNSFHGIGLSGPGASNNVILGNFIGTGLDGTGDFGNGQDGINLNGALNNLIGGAAPGAGNVISGNNGDGIEITGAGATGNQLLGNLIGMEANGATALGNTQNGVLLTSNARSNVIGGVLTGEGNRIANNVSGDGISVASGTNNAIRANAVFNNGDLGIDLGSSGKNANDAGDPDTGANQLQNFPLVTNATLNLGSTFVTGTFNSRPGTTYELDFFSSIVCDPSTNGEGQVYLGSTSITTGADSNALFSLTIPVTAVGRFITATATDPFGNTSEFGPCFRATSLLPAATFTVVNTNDSGPGSLRQAILDNNASYFSGANTIAFAIPGAGPHTIWPGSALPDITEPVTIDGFTQTNATPNTLPDGNNAVLQIRLRGLSFTDGLRLRASGCTVRGLVIVNWGGDGIEIANCDSNVVTGCFIGINSDGSAQFNNNSGITIFNSGGNRIGGTTPADRNAIIGLFLAGGSSNNIVQGNFIGCGLRGTNTVGFPSYGIILEDSTDNLIGGTVPGARNILSGHAGNAVHFRGTTPSRNVIAGNYIGPDVTGLRRLGNSRGISIEAGSSNRIGGATAAERNVISGNGSEGVAVLAPAFGNGILGNWIGVDATGSGVLTNGGLGVLVTGNTNRVGGVAAGEGNVIANNTGGGVTVNGVANSIRGNSIFNSVALFPGFGALGINLGFDDVTPNDSGDADAGANNLQNFPVLTAVTGSVSTVQIVGSLNSQPGTSYTLDFYSSPTCDPSGFGEGQTYLGSTTVVTDGGGNVNFNLTLPRPLAGSSVTATATDPAGNTSEFSACREAVSVVAGATFTVTTTNDSGPGSLRQAILDANNSVTAGNTIAFAIPGPGVQVIRLLSPLPVFIERVTIDGFTQTNASANTLSNGNNANWLVELNGSALPGFQQDGLRLNRPGTIVRGMRITGFNNDGIEVTASNCVVAGNLIVSNGNSGVHLLGPAARVGGFVPADRNVISANASYNIYLDGTNATANQILGNFIGTDATGTSDGGGLAWGVAFSEASGNTVGGTNGGAANVIAFHDDIAVFGMSGTNNAVRGNRIFENGGLGIDLGFQGVTANDLGDADTGANQLQNYPFITNATANVGSTQLRGTLNSAANATFALDFYSSTVCHWSGHGQGEFHLGSASVTTDGSGNASFDVTLPVTLQGNFVTVTATDLVGNTSEFSPCFAPIINLPGQIYTVVNTNDSGPGSLRQALLDSALAPNSTPDQIRFNIPGAGVQVISPLTPLAAPEDAVLIDGYSQPGAVTNTSSNANNAVILIQLDGRKIGYSASGLTFTNHGNIVRGVSFTGFGNALFLESASNVVEGCWIGLTPSGASGSNTGSGIMIQGPANRIGGTTFAARNLIAANEDYGIFLFGSAAASNSVYGNFIGRGPALSGSLGNGQAGVFVNGSAGSRIGGTNVNEGNFIAFNSGGGVEIVGGTNHAVRGNAILGNGGLGIDLGTIGVNTNDAGDLDLGPNFGQNYPVITNAIFTTSNLLVQGFLASRAGASYQLDFFASAAPDPAAFGEGESFLGAAGVTTDASGRAAFSVGLPWPPAGRFLAATATDSSGNTSEFGPVFRAGSIVPAQTFTVANTNDSGPGSLRAAIEANNVAFALTNNRIVFNIAGSGVRIIAPASALPTIAEPVTLDGYSQPGSSANTLSNGFDGVLLIRLDGANAGFGGVDGLRFTGSGNVVQGLIVTRFSGDGLEFVGSSNNVIAGNLIGLDGAPPPSGLRSAGWNMVTTGNRLCGINFTASPFNRVGGPLIPARNVITKNIGHGINLGSGSSDIIIEGNYIGADPSGTVPVGNGMDGVSVMQSMSGIVIENSVLAGNTAYGVNAQSGVVVNRCAIFGNGGGIGSFSPAPVLTQADNVNGSTLVSGLAFGGPGVPLNIQFGRNAWNLAGDYQFEEFRKEITVIPDDQGMAEFTDTITPRLDVGEFLTAFSIENFFGASRISIARAVTSPAEADVEMVSIVPSSPTAEIYDDVVFTVTLRNNGPATASGVLMRAYTALTIGEAGSQGTGVSQGTVVPLPGGGNGLPAFEWQVGTLAPGAVATFNVILYGKNIGSLTLSATVSQASPTDSVPDNNTTYGTAEIGRQSVTHQTLPKGQLALTAFGQGVFQFTPNLTPPVAWQNVPESEVIVNNERRTLIVDTALGPAGFYRYESLPLPATLPPIIFKNNLLVLSGTAPADSTVRIDLNQDGSWDYDFKSDCYGRYTAALDASSLDFVDEVNIGYFDGDTPLGSTMTRTVARDFQTVNHAAEVPVNLVPGEAAICTTCLECCPETQTANATGLFDGSNAPRDASGSGVELANGRTRVAVPVLSFRGPNQSFDFTLHHASLRTYDGGFGQGFSHSYNYSVVRRSPVALDIYTPTRGPYTATSPDYGKTWAMPAGFNATLRFDAKSASWRLRHFSGQEFTFYDAPVGVPGCLTSISDANKNTTLFDRDGCGNMTGIFAPGGAQRLTLNYSSTPHLESITDHLGRTWRFVYDASFRLTQIISPETEFANIAAGTLLTDTQLAGALVTGSRVTTLSYTNASFPNHVTSVTDARGAVTRAYVYDAQGRVSSAFINGREIRYLYNPANSPVPLAKLEATNTITRVIDREGNVTDYEIHSAAGMVSIIDGQINSGGRFGLRRQVNWTESGKGNAPLRAGEPLYWEQRWLHDCDCLAPRAVTQPFSSLDAASLAFDINKMPFFWPRTLYTYNTNRQVLTQIYTDGARSNRTETTYGGPLSRRLTHKEARAFDTNAIYAGLNFTHTYEYDADGNMTRHIYPTVTRGVASPQTVQETWTYNASGQVLTHTDANGNLTTYAYHSGTNAPGDINTKGDFAGYLAARTRGATGSADPAVNLVETFKVNALGMVTQSTDPNGNVRDFEYNALGELVREFDPVVTLRNGTTTRYEKRFVYDAAGNRVMARRSNRDYDGSALPNDFVDHAMSYDAANNLLAERREVDANDANDLITRYAYDGNDQQSVIQKPEGNRSFRVYDERGLPFKEFYGVAPGASVTDGYPVDKRAETLGGTSFVGLTRMDFDARRNPIRTRDGRGSITDRFYDFANRLVAESDPNTNGWVRDYDAAGQTLTIARGVVSKATGTLLSVLERSYTRHDELGRAYQRVRDLNFANDERAAVDPAAGVNSSVAIRHDAGSRIRTSVDANGNPTAFTYDAANRRVTVTDALNNVRTVAYDPNSNITGLTEQEVAGPGATGATESYTATFAYDQLNRRTQMHLRGLNGNSVDHRAAFAFDSRHNVRLVQDAEDNFALETFDDADRLVRSQRLDGDPSTGSPNQVRRQEFVHDRNTRLLEIRAFAEANNPASVQITRYAHDHHDRRVRTVFPDSDDPIAGGGNGPDGVFDRVETAFDANGNPIAITDQRGVVFNNLFDLANRLISQSNALPASVPGTTRQEFVYDALNRLVSARNNFARVDREYDALSRQTAEVQSIRLDGSGFVNGWQQPIRVQCSFDPQSNPTGCEVLDGALSDLAVTRTFDPLNRMDAVSAAYFNRGNHLIADYDYFGVDRIQTLTLGNGAKRANAFDLKRRLASLLWLNPTNGVLAGFEYSDTGGSGYDKVDNVRYERFLHDANRYDHFRYNRRYEVTGVEYRSPISTPPVAPGDAFDYDDVFNRRQASFGDPFNATPNSVDGYLNNAANEYTQIVRDGAPRNPVHDRAGNLTTLPVRPVTANPNQPDVNAAARWDAYNLLFDLDVGVNPAQHYRYDPFRRRVAALNSLANLQGSRRFIYDGWDKIEERVFNAGATPASAPSTLERIYVQGQRLDEPLLAAIDRDGDRLLGGANPKNVRSLTADQEYYFLANRLGSVAALLDADNANRVLEFYRYSINGEASVVRVVDNNSDGLEDTPLDLTDNLAAGPARVSAEFGNPLLFTARRFDDRTGLSYLRNRYYDQRSGRFINRDRLGYADGPNVYGYARNHYTTMIDPLGLACLSAVDAWKDFNTRLRIELGGRIDLTTVEGDAYGRLQSILSQAAGEDFSTGLMDTLASGIVDAATMGQGWRVKAIAGAISSAITGTLRGCNEGVAKAVGKAGGIIGKALGGFIGEKLGDSDLGEKLGGKAGGAAKNVVKKMLSEGDYGTLKAPRGWFAVGDPSYFGAVWRTVNQYPTRCCYRAMMSYELRRNRNTQVYARPIVTVDWCYCEQSGDRIYSDISLFFLDAMQLPDEEEEEE